jgi:hypothetical protein
MVPSRPSAAARRSRTGARPAPGRRDHRRSTAGRRRFLPRPSARRPGRRGRRAVPAIRAPIPTATFCRRARIVVGRRPVMPRSAAHWLATVTAARHGSASGSAVRAWAIGGSARPAVSSCGARARLRAGRRERRRPRRSRRADDPRSSTSDSVVHCNKASLRLIALSGGSDRACRSPDRLRLIGGGGPRRRVAKRRMTQENRT